MSIPQFCEIAMLCLFGCSWPFNIAKALRARTAKGKSVLFELLILTGYLIGLFGKLYAFRQTALWPIPSGSIWPTSSWSAWT